MSDSLLDPAQIAYIDEAGDDGLKTVRPIDPDGSAEWLMLSATLIDAAREPETDIWVRDILGGLSRYKLPTLHFRYCNTEDGRRVCHAMGRLPIRCFVVASNKKNMRGYHNPFAAQIPAKNWFYCWLTRLLLERVTYFACQKSIATYGAPRPLRIVFSERGRFSYAQLTAYYEWLRWKSAVGKNVLPLGDISWEVMRRELLAVHPNEEKSGLQLAHAVASSFFRACDLWQVADRDTQAAKLLEPRMARDQDIPTGKLHGFGEKLMPTWSKARLLPPQREIFEFYGYPHPQWWMPKRR